MSIGYQSQIKIHIMSTSNIHTQIQATLINSAIKNLSKQFEELTTLLTGNELDDSIHELFVKDYPFTHSFDEINVLVKKWSVSFDNERKAQF